MNSNISQKGIFKEQQKQLVALKNQLKLTTTSKQKIYLSKKQHSVEVLQEDNQEGHNSKKSLSQILQEEQQVFQIQQQKLKALEQSRLERLKFEKFKKQRKQEYEQNLNKKSYEESFPFGIEISTAKKRKSKIFLESEDVQDVYQDFSKQEQVAKLDAWADKIKQKQQIQDIQKNIQSTPYLYGIDVVKNQPFQNDQSPIRHKNRLQTLLKEDVDSSALKNSQKQMQVTQKHLTWGGNNQYSQTNKQDYQFKPSQFQQQSKQQNSYQQQQITLPQNIQIYIPKRIKRLGDIKQQSHQQNLALKQVFHGYQLNNQNKKNISDQVTGIAPIDELHSIEQMQENMNQLKISQQYDNQNFLQYNQFLVYIKNQINALQSLSDQTQTMDNMKIQAKFYEKAGYKIQLKLQQKISSIEAFILNKQSSANIIRNENSKILKTLTNIQTTIITIKQAILDCNKKIQQQEEQKKLIMEQLEKIKDKQKPAYKQFKKQQMRTGMPHLTVQDVKTISQTNMAFQFPQNQQHKKVQFIRKTSKDFSKPDAAAIQSSLQSNEVRTAKIKTLQENKKYFYMQWEFNNQFIDTLDKQIQIWKKELKRWKKIQTHFYLNVMKIGKDVRDIGLSWILIELHFLGISIQNKQFPDFLDNYCIEFLKNKAKKLIEIQDQKILLKVIEDNYKQIYRKRELMHNKNNNCSADQNQNQIVLNTINVINQKEFVSNTLQKIPDSQCYFIKTPKYGGGYQESFVIDFNNNKKKFESKGYGAKGNVHINNKALKDKFKSHLLNKSAISALPKELLSDNNFDETNFNNDLVKIKKYLIYNTPANLQISLGENIKETWNHKIYKDSQQKIQQLLLNCVQKTVNQSKKNPSMPNIANKKRSIQNQINNFSFQTQSMLPNSFNNATNVEEENNEYIRDQILLFDNDELLNKYDNKDELLKQYDQTKNNILELEKELVNEHRALIKRIIIEFDFRQYERTYNTDCITVLAALLGASAAHVELIRNAMTKLIKNENQIASKRIQKENNKQSQENNKNFINIQNFD